MAVEVLDYDDVAMLDGLPPEPLRPPPKFEMYLIVSTRVSETLLREPPSHERDDVLSRLRDAILRLMLDPREPAVH